MKAHVNRRELARFFAKVQIAQDGCWLWRGALNRRIRGYGHLRVGTGNALAHRFAYAAFVAPLDPAMEIDHLCRNTTCVNPAHLEAVTRLVNKRRQVAATQPNSCRRGHEYTPQNLKMNGANRACRECIRLKQIERRARSAAKTEAA